MEPGGRRLPRRLRGDGARRPGQITGAEGEKFTAGKLGEHEIGETGEIILGPPTRFNKENIDDFDF